MKCERSVSSVINVLIACTAVVFRFKEHGYGKFPRKMGLTVAPLKFPWVFLALHSLPSLPGQAGERKRRGSWRLRSSLSPPLPLPLLLLLLIHHLTSRAAICRRRSSESRASVKKRVKLFQKLTWQMTLLPQKMRWVWQHFILTTLYF